MLRSIFNAPDRVDADRQLSLGVAKYRDPPPRLAVDREQRRRGPGRLATAVSASITLAHEQPEWETGRVYFTQENG